MTAGVDIAAYRGLLVGDLTALSGPDPGTPVTTAPPMPTTSKDSTWSLQWSQDFNTPVAAGSFMSAGAGYAGTAQANDIGTGKFNAFTYPGYLDTRMKHLRRIDITTVAGSTSVTASAAFPFRFEDARGYIRGPASDSSPFPVWTRVNTVSTTTSAVMSAPATAGGTFSVNFRVDGGFYDERSYWVTTDSTLRYTLYTDSADGRHHVAAISPKLNGINSSPTGGHFGGRFTICSRVPQYIPGFKQAFLLFPASSNWPTDGEIDIIEQEYKSTAHGAMFVHWQGGTSGNSQSGFISTMNICDGSWWTYSMEWRPNSVSPALSTIKGFIQGSNGYGSLTTPFLTASGTPASLTGTQVPRTNQGWTWQTETSLDFLTPIPDSSTGIIEIAWATYEKMV